MLSFDAYLKPLASIAFRSGSANAIGGVNKLDISTQSSGINARPIPRMDPDNISADRKDRIIGLDKEKTIVKTISKYEPLALEKSVDLLSL